MLFYLSNYLLTEHTLENLSFGEDTSNPWKEDTKNIFLKFLVQDQ